MKLKTKIIISTLMSSLTLAVSAASLTPPTSVDMQNMKANQSEFNGMQMDMGQMNMTQNGYSAMPMNMNNMQMDMNRMPMNMGSMNMNGMPMSGYRGQQPMNLGQNQMPFMSNNNSMPMMKMMQQKSQAMRQHQQTVEMQLTNINNSLQQLIALQKAK